MSTKKFLNIGQLTLSQKGSNLQLNLGYGHVPGSESEKIANQIISLLGTQYITLPVFNDKYKVLAETIENKRGILNGEVSVEDQRDVPKDKFDFIVASGKMTAETAAATRAKIPSFVIGEASVTVGGNN